MGKSTHFLGQPILGQLLNYLNKQTVLKISRENGGEISSDSRPGKLPKRPRPR